MNGLIKNCFWKIDPYETVANAMQSTQNLTPGRFWHATVESDVKNLQILNPDLKIQIVQLQIVQLQIFQLQNFWPYAR